MAPSEKLKEDNPIYFGGSCACGRITYESRCMPTSSSACHCVTCRKLSGAAFQCFPDVSSKEVTFYDNKEHLRHEGLPKDDIGGLEFLRLSSAGERAFCVDCHTPLAMRYKHQPDVTGITLGSVDEQTILDERVKEALRPKARIFMEQNAWWFEPKDDGLRTHQRFGGSFEQDMKAWELRARRTAKM
ncbi:hypothetical protein LTR09_001518 [Extremus antarcticus]|uniref:CENP-V/GFA domain-containing protein n=1 Tax=Extremus antarcticus TaxID=702011 RepID=A0AAJ0GH11_9PEZI|nr:hypothetical protein LTR09_001518 [Extremus antarcticus]